MVVERYLPIVGGSRWGKRDTYPEWAEVGEGGGRPTQSGRQLVRVESYLPRVGGSRIERYLPRVGGSR